MALTGIAWFAWPRAVFVRSHWRWIARAMVGFAAPALIGLALLGRLDTLVVMPAEFAPLASLLPRFDPYALAPAIAVGMAAGLTILRLRIDWARRHGRPLPSSVVRPAPLAAAHPGERWPATAVALAAGVTEELAFRLWLPLSIAILSGSALLGFAVATIVFTALHRYQSPLGMAAVALIGVVLAAGYLATGSLVFVMIVHAALDVAALVVRPWLARFSS